jgi:Ni,Fe-hydrogenase maturation factor
MRRVLIGTVGYHNLRDFSLGPKLLSRLRAIDWPAGVDVEEMNWGPIAIVQHFEALPTPYDRVLFLTALENDREPGTITLRRWRGRLPGVGEIQDRISEAVTGTISIYNLLVVGEYFKIWPDEVIVVDVEPGPEEAGDTFTPAIETAIPGILDSVRQVALADLASVEPLVDLYGDNLGDKYGLWARIRE